MKTTVFTLLFAFTIYFGIAQPKGWNFQAPVTINSDGTYHSFLQVLVEVNTQALITAGKLQAGCDDLRFASACGDSTYNYWIESDPNTDSTKIWVAVNGIPDIGGKSIYMFYGNDTASARSNFGLTFPTALVTGGSNVTLSSGSTYDWFQVDAGDTVFVQAGSSCTLTVSRKCVINGVIWGKGRGYQSPVINTIGTGPGGGGTSTNSGCGGGSYAGIGGTGGMDAGDTPGTGGPAYGTSNGTDLDMGSSGGSGTGISVGGPGGSGLEIISEIVVLNGIVNMDGVNAASDGTGRGGGGGAGGGVKISGETIKGTGSVSANGGTGASGTSTANDSGGGGGGGRIKLFYDAAIDPITTSVNGGIGGPNGTASPGQMGTAGSVYIGTAPYNDFPMGIVGTEQTTPEIFLSVITSPSCDGDTFTVAVNPGFSTFLWSTGDTTSSILVTQSDTVFVQATTNEGCVYIDSAIVQFLPVPVVSITIIGTIMDASAGFISYQWYLDGSILSAATLQTLDYTINGNGIYSVVVMASNTCTASATSSITVGIGNNEPTDVFRVTPNPTNGIIYINTGNRIADGIVLLDIVGKTITTFKPSAKVVELDLSPYATGIYYIRIKAAEKVKTLKVLKN